MMFHPSLKKISRYLDQQLTQVNQDSVKKHLALCEKCRKKVEILELAGSFLQVPEKIKEADSPIFLDGIETEKLDTQGEIVGEVKSVVGKVIVRAGANGNELEAFSGCALRKGDTLVTIGESKALVEWKDGSQIYINKNTELDFQTSAYPLTLRLGEIFSMMRPQRERFEIQTPAAVLSVIGTDFDTEVNKEKQTLLRVIKGKVAFKNKTGEVIVKKNKQVNAAEYSKPEVTPIQQLKTIDNWIHPIKPIQNKRGAIMKKLVIVILIVVIGVGGYFAYQYFTGTETKVTAPSVQSPDLPATTEMVSKEPLNFQPKWNVGEKKTIRMEINSDTDTQSSNKQMSPMKMKQNITEDLSLAVVAARPEGGYEIDFQIEGMRMEMNINTTKIVIDSNSETTVASEKAATSVFRSMVGKKIKLMLGTNGKVDSVSGMKEFMEGAMGNGNDPTSQAFSSAFNEDYFKNAMEGFNGTDSIPKHPVQVGESWPINKELNIPMAGKMKMEMTNTFTGWKEYEGVTCAVMNTSGTMKTTSAPTTSMQGMQFNIKEIKMAGYSFIDPVRGEQKEFSVNQNIVIEMKTQTPTRKGPQEQTMTMISKQTVTGKLINVEKIEGTAPSTISMDSASPMATDTTPKP